MFKLKCKDREALTERIFGYERSDKRGESTNTDEHNIIVGMAKGLKRKQTV